MPSPHRARLERRFEELYGEIRALRMRIQALRHGECTCASEEGKGHGTTGPGAITVPPTENQVAALTTEDITELERLYKHTRYKPWKLEEEVRDGIANYKIPEICWGLNLFAWDGQFIVTMTKHFPAILCILKDWIAGYGLIMPKIGEENIDFTQKEIT